MFITLCIVVLVIASLDISGYKNHHKNSITPVYGEQIFMADAVLRTGPISELWVEKILDGAKKRIWIGVYTFTLPDLREALLRAQKR